MNFLSNLFSGRHWSFESSSFWLLIATVVFSVVAFVPFASVPLLYTKVAVLALMTVATFISYVLARLTRGNIVTPPLALIGAIWLVPLAYGISTIFSSAPTAVSVFGKLFETDTFGFMLLVGVLGTLSALIVRRIDQHSSFLRAGAWLAGGVLAVQTIILVVGATTKFINPASSIMGSFGDFTIFAGLGVVMSLLAMRFMPLSKRTQTILGATIVAELIFLIIANSAFTWILVGVTALGVFVESVMRRISRGGSEESIEIDTEEGSLEMYSSEEEISVESDSSQNGIGIPLLVLAVSIFFVVGGSSVAGMFDSALHVNIASVRPSWQSTINVGRNTYKDNAVFGSGPNTFGQQWLKFRNASVNKTQFWNADFNKGIGTIPTSFVTTGVVGMVAWLAFLGLFLFIGLRALILRESDSETIRGVAVVVFVGASYLLLQLIFNIPGAVLVALTFVLVGVFASTLRYFEPREQFGISFSQSPRAGFAIVFVLTLLLLASIGSAYVVVERYVAQADLAHAGQALSTGNLDVADKATAQSLLFVSSDSAYRMEAVIGMNRIVRLLQSTSTKPTSGTYKKLQTVVSRSVAVASEATKLNPNNYKNWYVLGNVYKLVVPLKVSGVYKKAISAYKKAEELNPTSAVIPFTMAQLAIANKSYKDAETYLHKAVALKPDYTQAIFTLSQLDVRLGKAKEALMAAEAVAYFVPNDPAVLFQVGVLREASGDFKGAIASLSQAVAVSPKYANARYFLATAYAHQKEYDKALAQMEAISKLSDANAKAVAKYIEVLKVGKNPFVITMKAKGSTTTNGTTLPNLSGK